MPQENRNIWGTTVGIVRILYERLYGGDGTGNAAGSGSATG
jgi:hypothetical protein